MATAHNTKPGLLGPSPVMGRVVVALVALAGALAIVTMVNDNDGGNSSTGAAAQQAVVTGDVLTSGQAATAARLAGLAELAKQNVGPPPPSGNFGADTATRTPGAVTPSEIFEVRQFEFQPISSAPLAGVAPSLGLTPGQFDIASGNIPGITPRTYPTTGGGGEVWQRPGAQFAEPYGQVDAGTVPSQSHSAPANPRPEML